MTTTTDFSVATPALQSPFAERITALREAIAQRTTYRKTVRELQELSNRDLADLGIHRSAIKSIAYEAAYQK
jgi:uncharacterized protein YjiS (DUF1127 family)